MSLRTRIGKCKIDRLVACNCGERCGNSKGADRDAGRREPIIINLLGIRIFCYTTFIIRIFCYTTFIFFASVHFASVYTIAYRKPRYGAVANGCSRCYTQRVHCKESSTEHDTQQCEHCYATA